MTNNAPPRDDAVLAAEYALGVLQGPEREAFAKRMAADSALAETVRSWDEQFISFADEIAPVTPPANLQAAVEKRLFADAVSSPPPGLWNSLAFWRGLSVAAVAAVIGLGAWNLQKPVEPSTPALVAQVAGEAKAVQLAAYFDAAKGELRLNRTAGTAATGRSFELWLIAGQDAPVSLGLLPDVATTRIIVPEALRSKFTGAILAISDEPAGGSTTGAPTGAVLATGPLTAI
jgi:anti-sigma-K factor RskA